MAERSLAKGLRVLRALGCVSALLLLLVSVGVSAFSANRRPDTWGEHGMVLFGGRDGLFASHLPMFRMPHDYHVVLALRFADPRLDATLRERLAAKPELWTIVPEEFELARLAPGASAPIDHFKVDVVEGHFERGGKTVFKQVEVQVVQTLRFDALHPLKGAAKQSVYERIGRGQTWFLVKDVTARPDFDHIVMLAGMPAASSVEVPSTGIVRTPDRVLDVALAGQAHVVGTVYYDTQDLQ